MTIVGVRRWRWWVIGAFGCAGVALWLVVKPEPAREFTPWCGSPRKPIYITGPLRKQFLLLMSRVLDRYSVQHMIKDGKIFFRGGGYFPGLILEDGTRIPDIKESIDSIAQNSVWKIASDIAAGVTIDDAYFPSPPALAKAIAETEHRFGPYPRLTSEGKPLGGPDPRFGDCDLMRAAILQEP